MKTWKYCVFVLLIFMGSCKKEPIESKGTLAIGITDPRDLAGTKSDYPFNFEKLTKFEIEIASVELIASDFTNTSVLGAAVKIDLLSNREQLKKLLDIAVSYGSYKGLKVTFSGVSITYNGNTYTDFAGTSPSVTLACADNITITDAQGVPDNFNALHEYTYMFDFSIEKEAPDFGIQLNLDAFASCTLSEYTIPVLNTVCQFAVIRPQMHVGIVTEQGIQQIRHSPPLGLTFTNYMQISYFGIHTFMDFNKKGGTITEHTSQHVFRGQNADLLVDAEPLDINPNPLINNRINATSTTDIQASEVFKPTIYEANLKQKGYNLQHGTVYYFSLRKSWTIQTPDGIYTLTRICEPIPVIWP